MMKKVVFAFVKNFSALGEVMERYNKFIKDMNHISKTLNRSLGL